MATYDNEQWYDRPTAWRRAKEALGTDHHLSTLMQQLERVLDAGMNPCASPRALLAAAIHHFLQLGPCARLMAFLRYSRDLDDHGIMTSNTGENLLQAIAAQANRRRTQAGNAASRHSRWHPRTFRIGRERFRLIATYKPLRDRSGRRCRILIDRAKHTITVRQSHESRKKESLYWIELYHSVSMALEQLDAVRVERRPLPSEERAELTSDLEEAYRKLLGEDLWPSDEARK